MTTRLLPVLAAVGVLALSGCSASDDDAPGTGAAAPSAGETTAPDPGTDVETLEAVEPAADSADLTAAGLTLSVPAGWETGDQSGEGLTQLTALGTSEEGTRAAVNVVGVSSAETDLDAALAESRALGEVTAETQVSLPQLSTAGPATLLDLEVDIDGQPARSWVLVFEHQSSTYTVAFLSQPFDEELARQTLGTLRDA